MSKNVFFAAAAVFYFFLTVAFSGFFFENNTRHGGHLMPVNVNYDRSPSSQKFEQLQVRANEMRARLNYMVFEKERKEAQQVLVYTLQKQINLEPYQGYLWRDLVYAQRSIGDVSQQRLWSFAVANKLLKWNENERVYLSNFCVNNSAGIGELSKTLCVDLLENLPSTENLGALATKMGVSLELLQKVAGDYGVHLRNGR